MKNYFFILIAVMACTAINAQTDTIPVQAGSESKIQTIFESTGRVGWWVSPDFSWGQIDGRDAFLGGMSGGVIINHAFSIGLAGYGIMNPQNFKYSGILDNTDLYLYGGYGGLKLEYRLFPLNIINVGFPLLIGGGAVTYSTWGPDNWHNNSGNTDYVYTWDGFFVLEPGVVVGINLLKFMRLDAGVSYRYAPEIELPRTSSTLLDGFNVTASLKFGRF